MSTYYPNRRAFRNPVSCTTEDHGYQPVPSPLGEDEEYRLALSLFGTSLGNPGHLWDPSETGDDDLGRTPCSLLLDDLPGGPYDLPDDNLLHATSGSVPPICSPLILVNTYGLSQTDPSGPYCRVEEQGRLTQELTVGSHWGSNNDAPDQALSDSYLATKRHGQRKLSALARAIDQAVVDGYFPRGNEWPLSKCPTKRDERLDLLARGIVRPPIYRCEKNTCLYCVTKNMIVIAATIKSSRPTVHFTITLCPDNWPAVQKLMSGLYSYLDERGHKPSWAYAVERNPKGTGYHIHGYHHGPLKWWSVYEYCRSKGCGRATVEEVNFQRLIRFAYPMKTLLFEGCTTGAQAEQALAEYRQLNGTQLLHHTRDFFRDGARSVPETTACNRSRQRYKKLRSQAQDVDHNDLVAYHQGRSTTT